MLESHRLGQHACQGRWQQGDQRSLVALARDAFPHVDMQEQGRQKISQVKNGEEGRVVDGPGIGGPADAAGEAENLVGGREGGRKGGVRKARLGWY